MGESLTIKSYKFRIYPSKTQKHRLGKTLELCRELYNAALQERRSAWSLNRISLKYYDQANQLAEIKRTNPEYCEIHSQILQNVLKRVERSFENFFSRLKSAARRPGFPRFQGKTRYNSFTYPQSGFSLAGGKLKLSKIGKVKIKLHRTVMGRIKTLTIFRDACGKWFASFTVEAEKEILTPTGKSVGIDCGINFFVTLSDGTKIQNQKFFLKEEKLLAKTHRRLSELGKGTKEYAKKRRILAHIHARIKNRRNDFAHQESRILVNKFDRIFYEDLNIAGMMQNHRLAKSIADVAWRQLIEFTIYKAENAGKSCQTVNPRNTSQQCSGCGKIVKKDLSERMHLCPHCGLEICRDLNAALNILALGLQSIGQ